jgi:5'-phosphate synthase pdxT subunit
MLVGVLALQGAFREHQKALKACGVDTVQVRKPEHLDGLSGLVIPGGESTTMSKLLVEYHLLEPIIQLGRDGMPIFGTCAGLIMLAKEINGSDQARLGLMDIKVERNAFGRQVQSFEAHLVISQLGEEPFRGIFIRAPYIMEVGAGVEIWAQYEEKIVCVKQDNLLGAAFHPELTDDLRFHRQFIDIISNEPKCI